MKRRIAWISAIFVCLAVARCEPSETSEFRQRIARACEVVEQKQSKLKATYALGSYERYDWYQDRGVVIFSSGGKPKVIADIQFVGSTSKISGTWLWAWANSSLDDRLTEDSKKVRAFGAREGYEKLTTAKWDADETDGWEMTSLQAELTGAEGVYRSPDKNGASFLTLKNVRWAAPDEPYEPAPSEP